MSEMDELHNTIARLRIRCLELQELLNSQIEHSLQLQQKADNILTCRRGHHYVKQKDIHGCPYCKMMKLLRIY